MATTESSPGSKESFEALLNESLGEHASLEGTVLRGTVIGVEGDTVLVDVGLKSEGRIALKAVSYTHLTLPTIYSV